MLKEVDQNTDNMGSASNSPNAVARSSLAIHRTNLFQPHRFTVTSIAASPYSAYLAARRGYLDPLDINHPFSQLDFYEMNTKTHPKHVQTIIEYEDITGIAWLDQKRLITVSKQATINLYSIHTGSKLKAYTSDYGPIVCMRYSIDDDLLVTGTEYGYAVCYRMKPTIECVSKMVTLNEPIKAIDFHTESRETPVTSTVAAKPNTVTRAKVKPGKRKRAESSDESDDDDEADDQEDTSSKETFLATTNVTIYGACDYKVVAWDYHKKAILDTVKSDNKLCSLLALQNGDFAIGDMEGFLSIFDKNTYTCRQSDRILEKSVTCLARDSKGSTLLAAGLEPTITILYRNKADESEGDYLLFEQIKDHEAQVNGALCLSKREFYTCSEDNLIIKFRTSKSKGHRELKRYNIRQNYKFKIHWSTNELLLIFGKTLLMHKITSDPQFRSEIVSYPIQQTLMEPPRTCSIKPALLIHAATFDDKWICYSTSKGITTIDRPALSRIGEPSKNLPCCHIMKLCQSGKYLVAGQCKTLTITELDNEPLGQQNPQTNEDGDSQTKLDGEAKTDTNDDQAPQKDAIKRHVHKTIMCHKMRGYIRNIIYHESSNRVIVTCGTNAHFVYVYELPQPSSVDVTNGHGGNSRIKQVFNKTVLKGCSPSSFLAVNHHDKSDTNLYVLTTKNEFVRYEILDKQKGAKLDLSVDQNIGKISGLSKESNILGLVVLSRRYGLLYDSDYIYKLDMDANEIVNTTTKYGNINVVCDTIFGRQDEILII